MYPFALPSGGSGDASMARSRRVRNRAWLAVAAGSLLLGAFGWPRVSARQAPFDPSLYAGLKWRMLGPFRGGRVDAVSGVSGRPNEFYFGSVNGGVWKSIDAGRVWTPVFDSQPVASVGALAVAPSNPNVVYVGTGESTLRDSVGYGNGMYKSTDAGKTWTHIGLDQTQHIGKVAVDPRDPNIVFVAAIGHLYAANSERGVFRSTDGGKIWQKVLYKNENIGAVDVAIDPTNSRVIYAGLWNTRRPPWYVYAPSNGPGGGIYKSADGGLTWSQLTKGLPAEGIGRTGIAIAPSNPRRVYAVIDDLLPEPSGPPTTGPTAPQPPAAASGRAGGGQASPGQGGFFRSDDAGAMWMKLSGDTALWGRGWYFEKLVVDPKDADIVYVPNVSVSRSKDGGKTWVALRGSPGGDDYHQAWISPDDPNTMIVASDQGAIITRNARTDDPKDVTWSSWLNQPTAQLYHVSVTHGFPWIATAAQQDSGAVLVRSRGIDASITMRDWNGACAGGESGYTAADPLNPAMLYGGTVSKCNIELNGDATSIAPPRGADAARTDWTQPLVFSRADPHALYYANQYLYKTSDGGASWTQLSQDMTRSDPGIPPTLDEASAALTDRNGKRGVIYTIAPSPVRAPVIWIGTDDGLIHLTQDDGKTWQNVTPPSMTSWSRVTMMEASHVDANEAYAAVDRHQLQDFEPYVYRTRDAGKTWLTITKGLPGGSYMHTIKEDPMRRGLLFAGSERGVYLSFDDGDSWQSLQLNLPVTSMRDLEIHGNDLVLATHGRGFWVIDDIAPLRQINDEVARADAFLFKPSDAIYAIQGGDNGTPVQKDEPQAQNPPNGATIDYYLKSPANGPVTFEILDAGNATLATFSNESAPVAPAGRGRGTGGIPNTSALWRTPPEPISGAAGMHRVTWAPGGGGRGGFAGGPAGAGGSTLTGPAGAAGAPPARGNAQRGGRGGRGAPGGAPVTGTFTAKLTVNGKSYTQTFSIRPDPRLK
jgi:photosystem II stability/assembly factor-like uncharacterized protein